MIPYAAAECPDGPDATAYEASVRDFAGTVAASCDQAGIEAALRSAAGRAGVWRVDITDCAADLHRSLYLPSEVVLWGPGATLTQASDFVGLWTTYRKAMVVAENVHESGVVGVTLVGDGSDMSQGIRVLGASHDLVFHDIHTVRMGEGLYLGTARHRPPVGEQWPSWSPLDPEVTDVSVTCSSFVGSGRVAGTLDGYGCEPYASTVYGTGVAAADTTRRLGLSHVRTECSGALGLNLHTQGVEVTHWTSRHDLSSKFPGVEDLHLHDSVVVEPVSRTVGARTTALRLDRSEAWTPYTGETYYRYPARVTIEGVDFTLLGNDLALTTQGGHGVTWGACTYAGPGRPDGSTTGLVVDVAYPWSGWTIACDTYTPGTHHCEQPGGTIYIGPDSGFAFDVETP